jgi:hypothetical protein
MYRHLHTHTHIYIIYCAGLQCLTTPSGCHTPLFSVVPFAHSQVSFMAVYIPFFQVLRGWPRFFLPSYAGGSVATGRVSLAGQDEGERSDRERYPGSPGWGLRRWTSTPTLGKMLHS